MKAARRPTGPFEIVPRGDRELPVTEQSRFLVRPLSLEERMATYDMLSVSGKVPDGTEIEMRRHWRVYCDLVRTHLVSTTNFPAGEPKPWPKDGTADEREAYLQLLPDLELYLLGLDLFNASILEDHAGNSSRPGPMSTSAGPSRDGTSTTASTASETPG